MLQPSEFPNPNPWTPLFNPRVVMRRTLKDYRPVRPRKKKNKLPMEHPFGLKRKTEGCSGGEDLFSKLPDDILVFILSFLTAQESVRCSILSRRWAPLPQLVPLRLQFVKNYTEWSHQKFNELRTIEEANFISAVYNALFWYQGQTLDEFNICFPLDNRNKYHIKKWIRFAMYNKVKKFELDFSCFHGLDADQMYRFPERLRSGDIDMRGGTSLTSLRLHSVKVTGEQIEQFLEYCPFLESVCVLHSDTLRCLKVDGHARLKLLDIQKCYNLQNFEVSAPNLKSFKYLAGSKTSVLLKSAPQLTEMLVGYGFYSFLLVNLNLFTGHLSQIETLSLIVNCDNVEELQWPVLSNLKQLTITIESASSNKRSICLTSWIEASPLLRKFVIKKQGYCYLPPSLKPREAMDHGMGLYQHLKEFEFVGFFGDDSDTKFVHFMIENAMKLDKITIDCRIFVGGTRYLRTKRASEYMSLAKECVRNLSSTVEFVLLP